MTVAFEGPAGTGKTYSLMARLEEELAGRLSAPHERVLALTFMHGSRRRLDAKLREIEGLAGRFEASTVDSFAFRLVQRWRALLQSLGHEIPAEEQYDRTCALAAELLSRPAVAAWVAMSYPMVLVDEAQDLNAERSVLVRHIAGACRLLLAYDEFQCLNTALLPIPIEAWLPELCEPTRLTLCRRTNNAELLAAARALRDGQAVRRDGRRFKVKVTPGRPNFAATCLANAIAWRQDRGTVAVLTPSRRGGFADGIVGLVRAGPIGQHGNGPFPVRWESSEQAERTALWQELAMPARCSAPEALAALEGHLHVPAVKAAKDWIIRQRRVLGMGDVTANQVRCQIDRAFAARRRYGSASNGEFAAMTIQQAKNREFDHAVIIWPYTVPNEDEQRRRLLYNAVTRAKRSCLVLVQAQDLADAPPFVP